MKVPSRSEPDITKNELIATRRAKLPRISVDARRVRVRKTSADPGGFTIGKTAASTISNVSIGASISLCGEDERIAPQPLSLSPLKGLGSKRKDARADK
jgi:hypothetical protein